MNQFLTYISDSEGRKAYYQCVCGNTVEFRKDQVNYGYRKSCGCQTKDGRVNGNNRRQHPLYNIWTAHHRQTFPSFELFVAELGNPPFEGATVTSLIPGTTACPGNVGWGRPWFKHGNDRLNPELFMPLDPKEFGQYNIAAHQEETDASSYVNALNLLTKKYDSIRLKYQDDPVKMEEEIEKLSITEAVDKYDRSEAKLERGGRAASSTTWQQFRALILPTVVERLQQIHNSAKLSRSGIHHHIITPLVQKELVGYEEMALIGLNCVLDALGDGTGFKTPLTTVFKNIGLRIDDQCYLRWWESHYPSEFGYVDKWILNSNSGYHHKMRKAVTWIQNNIQEPPANAYQRIGSQRDSRGKRIGDEPLVHLGEWVFQGIQSCTLWFAAEKMWDVKGKTDHKRYFLGLSPEGMKWRDLINQGIKELLFEAQPMVCEPVPWPEEHHKHNHGGYLKPMPLNFSKLIHGWKGTKPSPEVIRSLNKLQNVGWKINPFMYHTLSSCLGQNIRIGEKFVCHERNEFLNVHWPEIDPAVWMLDKSDPEYKKAKAQIARTYAKCKTNEQLAENPYRALKTAAKFLNFERIHFNAFLDNRLRAYYLQTSGLSPQGANYAKSLLLFADPLPVTDENREAVRRDLLISLSNCWGHDKVSLDDRVVFAEKLARDLEWVAKEPLASGALGAWSTCSEPFVFLATLRQFHEIFTWKTRSTTDIPNGRDASSSGLQLMGAMLREKKAMEYTNVIPSEVPADLYAEVARHSKALLTNEVWMKAQLDKRLDNAQKKSKKTGKELNVEHFTFDLDPNEHVGRKTTKRAVMTDSYNASWLSKNEYISEELMTLEQELGRKVTLAEKAIVTTAIVDGQTQAFPVCKVIKDHFAQVVLYAIGEGGHTEIKWVTPDGSVICQRYNHRQVKQIQTFACGGASVYKTKTSKLKGEGAIYLSLTKDTDEVNAKRHALSLSPNVHHAYDAYICHQTILNCGTDSIAAIHDCWAWRAGEVEAGVMAAKQAFLALATSDVMEKMLEMNGLQDMMTVPCFGDDSLLAQVLDSPYMFA